MNVSEHYGNAWAVFENSDDESTESESESEEEVLAPIIIKKSEGMSKGQIKRKKQKMKQKLLLDKQKNIEKGERRQAKAMRNWNAHMEDDGFQMVNTRKSRQNKKWENRKGMMKEIMAGPPSDDEGKRAVPKCRGTVYVPGIKRGAIIGTGGCILKTLQELTGARINMPERDSESPVVVMGPTEGAVNEVVTAIKQLVDQGFCELLESQKPESERRRQGIVEVPVDKRKQFFGTKGCNILALRKAFDVEINCPDRNSDSEQVILTGNSMVLIAQAKKQIRKLCEYGFCETTHPGWVMKEFPVNPGEMGFVVGHRGTNIKSIRGNLKGRVDISILSSSVLVKGVASDVDRAMAQFENCLNKAYEAPTRRGRGEEEPTELAPFEREDNLDETQQQYIRQW